MPKEVVKHEVWKEGCDLNVYVLKCQVKGFFLAHGELLMGEKVKIKLYFIAVQLNPMAQGLVLTYTLCVTGLQCDPALMSRHSSHRLIEQVTDPFACCNTPGLRCTLCHTQ